MERTESTVGALFFVMIPIVTDTVLPHEQKTPRTVRLTTSAFAV